MGGALLNMLTVAIGSMIGLLIGNRFPERIQNSVVTGLSFVILYVGISNVGTTGNIIIPLISLVSGVIIGELLNLDALLERFGSFLQQRFGGQASTDGPIDVDQRQKFVQGFVTASLLFCIGPLTFVGSIQDGMGLPMGFQQIAIKSVLDGFAAMAFASSLGIGVAFSLITILIIQGGLSLAGSMLGEFLSQPMINEMSAVGGLILIGLALILLDLKKPRMANFLPALIIAPVIVAVANLLGLNIYPL